MRVAVALGLAALALLVAGCGGDGEETAAAPDLVYGQDLFLRDCAGCHALAAASSDATMGPDLDRTLRANAEAAGAPLDEYVRTSIVDTNAFVSPGYPSGLMPLDFGERLPESDLDALVAFVVDGVGGPS